MPNLFSEKNKKSVYHGVQCGMLSGISVDSLNSKDTSIGVIITGVSFSKGVKIAYFTTLSESIYIYPLGNKVGKCVVTGIAFPTCSVSSSANKTQADSQAQADASGENSQSREKKASSDDKDNYSNLKKLMDFYEKNKGSNFTNISKPIKVIIGETVLAGILEDMQVSITNENHQFGLATFNIMLSVIPEE